ncbi:conserved virulence factor C family protein [Ornithinibacillus scapharcae]|uniref:conserved virulence factor C family protein n=1 Tax=Ornithinibacillus scapharcae TaxID=1147159 RepID=UPI000225C0EE|nr:conserved virulence factor C family protein [Ornithinibacillus scapharcae]
MKIVSMEPTPSPYSMKINVDEIMPDGKTENYKLGDDLSTAPSYIQSLFSINGVKGIYRVIDFIALERDARTPWEEILPEVRQILGSIEKDMHDITKAEQAVDEHYGEIKVFIQMFRFIPTQVKLEDGEKEYRFGLPERFMHASIEASVASDNMLAERKWVEQSPRYGEVEEIGNEVLEEISAAYDNERLKELVRFALENKTAPTPWRKVTLEMLDHPDWKERYAVLDKMDPSIEDLPVLDKALDDEKASIRRLATAYLGMIDDKAVLPYLYKALKDKAVNVRRTAGDCLSDLSFTEAMPEMIKTLKDSSRLVRWRAAMFLYELGDETAIPALLEAQDDPEFEVRMQIKMALARIQGGEEAKGSIWHQMTQLINKDK